MEPLKHLETDQLKTALLAHKQRQRESSQMVAAINRELKIRKKAKQ